IDDRKAAHAQSNRTVQVESVVIGTPVAYRSAHLRQQHLVDGSSVTSNYAYDSTQDVRTLLDAGTQIKRRRSDVGPRRSRSQVFVSRSYSRLHNIQQKFVLKSGPRVYCS